MHMPKPQQEHERLEALAGTWTGRETMHPSPWDPKGGTATAKVVSRMDVDGFFLVTDYVQERDGQVTYRAHGVFGYGPQSKQWTLDWFDSMGDRATAYGKLEGKTLMFQSEGPRGHGRYIYTLEADGRYLMAIDSSQDGRSWSRMMEGTYTRG